MIRALALAAVLSLSPVPVERQKARNWCWAACVKDVLAERDISTTQVEIAARLDGWPRDRPAYVAELVALLRSYGVRAHQAGRPGTPEELYGSLEDGGQLIAFVRPSLGPVGHFIFIEGYDKSTGFLRVMDPATGVTSREPATKLYRNWRWGDSVVIPPERKERCPHRAHPGGHKTPCQHLLHPGGHRVPCVHPAHSLGDLVPCRHAAHQFDVVPCQHWGRPHWNGDRVPCSHPLHPAGDRVPCQHQLHPAGDATPCTHLAHPAGDDSPCAHALHPDGCGG